MRLLVLRFQVFCLVVSLTSSELASRARAQELTPPAASEPTPAVVEPSAAEPVAPSAREPVAPIAIEPAIPSAPAAPAVVPLPPLALTPPSRADAWVQFEQQRDVQTARGEKLFFPLSLALQAGLGVGLAAVSHGPTGSRIALGAAGGLAAAAILPTILSSRDGSRAWFGVGSAAFSLGLGASLIALDLESRHNDEGSRHANGRFLGSAVMLQGLVMLPIGLMAGFPGARDYEMYWKLPQEARPEAAARILRQIDRYEQRTTAFVLFGALAAAVVLSAGVISVHNSDERKQLAAASFIPLGTSLIAVLPRLFAGSRMEHYAVGDAPRRMAFNAW